MSLRFWGWLLPPISTENKLELQILAAIIQNCVHFGVYLAGTVVCYLIHGKGSFSNPGKKSFGLGPPKVVDQFFVVGVPTFWTFPVNVMWCIRFHLQIASKLMPAGYFSYAWPPVWVRVLGFKEKIAGFSPFLCSPCAKCLTALKILQSSYLFGILNFENLFNSSRFCSEPFCSVSRKNGVPEGICHVQSVRNFVELGRIWAHALHNSYL